MSGCDCGRWRCSLFQYRLEPEADISTVSCRYTSAKRKEDLRENVSVDASVDKIAGVT